MQRQEDSAGAAQSDGSVCHLFWQSLVLHLLVLLDALQALPVSGLLLL